MIVVEGIFFLIGVPWPMIYRKFRRCVRCCLLNDLNDNTVKCVGMDVYGIQINIIADS